uniref:Uncharacterized protein n=1 Tax=Oryza meridionalis TaxID=40149 RepID=A0A0E0EWI9_9ORYZ
MDIKIRVMLSGPQSFVGATHSQRHTSLSSRRGGESGGGDSPRRREEAKSRSPRLQPGSAGVRSTAPSAEISLRGWGESGSTDSSRLQRESNSCNKAKSRTKSCSHVASEHVVASSPTVVETGLEFAKVDREAPAPRAAALGKAPTVVLCSSGKDTLNRRAVAESRGPTRAMAPKAPNDLASFD